MKRKLAVTVIGGFLGAGKTTLINRLLAASADRRTAVLVNDFGAINVDERLIESRDAGIMTLTNGCICCSLQSNLVEQVDEIVRRDGPAFDHLIIETSGVSDPGEILRALGYPRIRERITVSSVAAVVDAARFGLLTGPARQLAESQVLAADLVLISKLDMATADQVSATRAACEALGTRCLELSQLAALWDVLCTADPRPESGTAYTALAPPAHSSFEHWSFSEPGPYGLQALRRTLSSLPTDIYRVKGFTHLQEVPDAECVVQVVGDRVEIRRTDAEPRESRDVLVFIGARGRVDWTDVAGRLRACQPARQRACRQGPQ
ncbi:MAG TPA: GTP-binding protein [Steroidobacteraceae bacterium]|nr:GTP-binding protein [Steroidobacteraceae bacterium]